MLLWETSIGVPKSPPAGRTAAREISLAALSPDQATTAAPELFIATSGTSGLSLPLESETAFPKTPPGGIVAAWMKLSLNPVSLQATVAVPPELTASAGDSVAALVVEMGPRGLKLPPGGRTPASITRFAPSPPCHAATASPAASIPIAG